MRQVIKIKIKKRKMKSEEILKFLQELNDKIDRDMNGLKKEKIKKKIYVLKPGEGKTTHYDKCKNNCHHPSDCWFSGLDRSKVLHP